MYSGDIIMIDELYCVVRSLKAKRRKRAIEVLSWSDEEDNEEPDCQPGICRINGMDLDPALDSATYSNVSLNPKYYLPDLYLKLSSIHNRGFCLLKRNPSNLRIVLKS